MEEVAQTVGIWNSLPAIISSVGTIIAAYFAYNQYAKNKKTDAKLEQWKHEQEKKNEETSYNVTVIYGELWSVLHELDADRVYIVQPHPLIKTLYFTIQLEVRRQGVSPFKGSVQAIPIAEAPITAQALVSRDFIYYDNILTQMKDRRTAGILNANGTTMVVARRLSDDKHEWIGTLVADFNHHSDVNPSRFREVLGIAASKIQYILPEIQ